MTEIQRLAAAIKTISEVYLGRVVKSGDRDGIAKWSLRLADYSTRLAILVSPQAALAKAEVADLNPVLKAPNFGDSAQMSSALYGDWATEWFQRTFPEAYRDYPPTVHAVAPGAIAEAANRDGCLAQVCAASVLGTPDGAWSELGDFSLYTALTGESSGGQFIHKVWHMGKLVGEKVGGPDDGLEFAHSLGFEW
jgi:hypothetical protein